MSTPNQQLLARYHKHIARMKARGAALTSYPCPVCKKTIEAARPPAGQEFDSMVECGYCGELHFKTVFSDGLVRTHRPSARKQQRGFSLVGLLASLVLLGVLIGAAVGIASWFIPTAPVDARPRLTVTITPTRIEGQIVNCIDIQNHQTGTRSHAC